MDIKELMKINIENLAETQYKEYKRHLLSVVGNIKEAIEKENMDLVKTFSSPAGDDYGLDNNCIDFSYNDSNMDFVEAFAEMTNLRDIAKKNKKGEN